MIMKSHVKCLRLVVSICVLQYIFIAYLFIHRNRNHWKESQSQLLQDLVRKDPETQTTRSSQISSLTISSNAEEQEHVKKYAGAAVFLNLHQPTWFQRRYSMMIQNVDSNLPADWVIQIFWTGEGQSKAGIDINWGGLHRLVESGRMVLTTIPKDVFAQKRKKFELMVEPWIWENMLSDTVFLFGGTSVICSNSPYSITNFTQWDYIGSPWSFKKGIGGDGE